MSVSAEFGAGGANPLAGALNCFNINVDYAGNDLRRAIVDSASNCQKLCSEEEKCEFFTWATQKKTCYLKHSNRGQKPTRTSTTSGPKSCIGNICTGN